MNTKQATAVRSLHAIGKKPKEISTTLGVPIDEVRAVLAPPVVPEKPKAASTPTPKQTRRGQGDALLEANNKLAALLGHGNRTLGGGGSADASNARGRVRLREQGYSMDQIAHMQGRRGRLI